SGGGKGGRRKSAPAGGAADDDDEDEDEDDDVDTKKTSSKRRRASEADGGSEAKKKKKAAASVVEGPPKPVKVEVKKEELKTPEERLKRLRSKLQNFLQNDHSEAEHFSKADKYLTEVENFKVDIELLLVRRVIIQQQDLLPNTKIGKVMRRISEMTFNEDKYKIIERSKEIVEHWKQVVDA
ncbi:hypothetical protein BC830DRAFT_1086633, partial [Chytriomyces sp. MP71]